MDLSAVDQFLARVQAAKDADLRPCPLVTDAFEPIPAHRAGVAHLMLRPRFLLADPVGCGKTPQALVAFGYLKEKDPTLRGLVVTTASAQFQWKAAIERFLRGVTAEVLGFEVTPTGRPRALSARKRRQQLSQPVDIWITGYHMLAQDLQPILSGLDHYVLMLDEVQTVANHRQGVLYPAAARVSAKGRYVWGLSATPMMNGRLDELYAVMEVIRPGTFGAFSQYRKTYYQLELVKPKPWQKKFMKPHYKVLGYQNLPHLKSVIAPFVLRRPSEEIRLKLPPVTMQVQDILLGTKQRGLYDEIVAQHRLAGTKIDRLAALTYAQEAVDCPAVLGQPQIESAKVPVLLNVLKEAADQKVVVFTKFARVAQHLSGVLRKAGIVHGMITGQESNPAAREATRLRFQTDPAQSVILITTAGGQGLDLQAASVLVFYDLPWSSGELSQIHGRVRRKGSQATNILCVLLIAADTIDHHVYSTLHRKQQDTNYHFLYPDTDTLHLAPDPDTHTDRLFEAVVSLPLPSPIGGGGEY